MHMKKGIVFLNKQRIFVPEISFFLFVVGAIMRKKGKQERMIQQTK